MSRYEQMPSISSREIQKYLQRQTKLCDSRIENAYLRLSSRHGQRQPDISTSFERTLSSSCGNLGSRKYDALETAPRPSSAHERRLGNENNISSDIPRGILKTTQSPVANSRKISRGSPDQWFQRIMHVKKLSPLDLCEVFSYGDARKHPLVPLSHVCEVLFDLDPESANGQDPVTQEMEEFLYQFATDEEGKLMVNIREALRALDIWQSRVTSSLPVSPSKFSSDPQSKAVILEAKNKKLKDVISSLQDANFRLSRELDTAKLALSPKSQKESPTRALPKQSSVEVSVSRDSSSNKLQIVNLHEQELIDMANKLQFTGVKKLERFLVEDDTESTGFISLKQLCWILADQFELKVSKIRLIEVCMGMKFNSNAQLDYQEFVDVLMDILIYALPDIRESAKRKSLVQFDQYLQSGFPPGRENIRQLLDTLCSKYDGRGDQCISVSDMVRVFHVDLVKHHALELPFPLLQSDTVQLAQPFVQHKLHDRLSEGFLSYTEMLDAILGPYPSDLNREAYGTNQAKRALKWMFWRGIYMSLCGGNRRMEEKVVTQLNKILTRLDPDKMFTISVRNFKRIFNQHICSQDMEVLIAALTTHTECHSCSDSDEDDLNLRYDVLLKLTFGFPELCDQRFFEKFIQKKLLCEQRRIQSYLKDLSARGDSNKFAIHDFHGLFIAQAEQFPLTIIEMLYLFGTLDANREGSIELKTLKTHLSAICWSNDKQNDRDETSTNVGESTNVDEVKQLISKCCSGYDFQRPLKDMSRHTQGWISQTVMVKELEKMLYEMGVVGVQQDDLKDLVRHISQHSTGNTPRASTRDSIHTDGFFDALFDWNAIIKHMRLPDSLVEMKKIFAIFDSKYTDTIQCEDWNKAYRQICRDHHGMSEWEIQVLQRRFPGHTKQREQKRTIDYGHLIVFLLDYQQRQARKLLQLRVVEHFQQMFVPTHSSLSTAEVERLFRAIDTTNKGYFDVTDLKRYLTTEFSRESEQGLYSDSIVLLNNNDALESVMWILAGETLDHSRGQSEQGAKPLSVITFDRFSQISTSFREDNRNKSTSSNHILSNAHMKQSRLSSGSRIGQKNLAVHPSQSYTGIQNEESCESSRTISSLRVLELTVVEIANDVASFKGNILPARAFRYLSFGPKAITETVVSTPPSSPIRRSSPTNRNVRSSVAIRKPQRELESSNLDPLTPARLKQILQVHHSIEVSTHLISQFFLHIGSPSKYFLDLIHFAQWVAPLSVEMQAKVRDVVRQMIVKGKGGGGKLDLDRFLAQLQRRLQDSPSYMASVASFENPPLQLVSTPLLLSKLHQLNIPLHKQELIALLRHFGMEGDLEAVDYGLFLQRLYELDATMLS